MIPRSARGPRRAIWLLAGLLGACGRDEPPQSVDIERLQQMAREAAPEGMGDAAGSETAPGMEDMQKMMAQAMEQAGAAAEIESGGAEPEPRTLLPLPDAIVSQVRAIAEAREPAAAVQATRALLAQAGVAIYREGAAVPASASGIAVSESDLITLAFEAQARATRGRITLAELIESISALGGLRGEGDTGAGPDASGNVSYEYGPQERQWVAFINEWIAVATKFHDPGNPTVAAVTSAPLYLAALAAQQSEPVDLRAPFFPSDVRLGPLDAVLVLAGLRTTLKAAYPRAFPVPAGTGLLEGAGSARLAPAVYRPDLGSPAVLLRTQAPSAECEALKRSLSGNAQAGVDAAGSVLGEAIEAALGQAVEKLGRKGGNFAKFVGPLFDVLGILTKWLSLMLLYNPDNFTLDLTVEPESVHKPVGGQVLALATIKVRIPDEKWRELRREQANQPVMQLLKGCARSLGIPVLQDLASIGAAMGNWHVAWDVRRGAPAHVTLPGNQFLGEGGSASRHETQLRAVSDHAGESELIMEVQHEKKQDHPGEEIAADIEVCGEVRTDEPPSIQTFVNSGVAGLTKEATTLLLALSDILAGMAQNAWTLDVCGDGKVTYHVPKGGRWQGRIEARSESINKQMSSSSYQGRSTLGFSMASNLVTDQIYVRSYMDEPKPGLEQNLIAFKGRQYTSGGYLKRAGTITQGRGARPGPINRKQVIGCDYTETSFEEVYGNWTFDTEGASATLTLHEDGRYEIMVANSGPDDQQEISVPGKAVDTFEAHQGNDCPEGREPRERDITGSPPELAATIDGVLRGQLNPEDPGNQIKGSKLFYRDKVKTKISWELTHEGPIRLPKRDTSVVPR